jgi:non-heme chloroperoxidase
MTRHKIQLTLPSGVTLDGVEQGPRTAPTVMLIHGYSDSWTTWAAVLDNLPDDLRAVALTMRGHGNSAKPLAGYTIGDFAGDVLASMDALGIGAATLVGHSMGSLIAERIALDAPGRVDALVLVGAFAGTCGAELVEAMWNDGIGTLVDPVDPEFVRAFQESCLAGPVAVDFEAIVAGSRKMPAHVWQQALKGFVSTGVEGRLGSIRVPTLLQWGDLDLYATRDHQDALLAAFPNARLSVFEGVGHCPNWEQPGRAAAEIAELVLTAAPVAA